MTAVQKLLAACGLAAMALTLMAAPYHYIGSVPVVGGKYDPRRAEGTIYRRAGAKVDRGIWVDPSDVDAVLPDSVKREYVIVEQFRLDTGRLGLWWAGIAAVTIVAMVVAAPRRGAREGA